MHDTSNGWNLHESKIAVVEGDVQNQTVLTTCDKQLNDH